MKGFFQPQYPTKWFMFGGLCATLGFSLSMNPQHFNNIARWTPDQPLNAVHFASEALIETEETKTVTIPHNGQLFDVEYAKVKDVDNQYIARFKGADETAAEACTGCGTLVPISATDQRDALRQISLKLSELVKSEGVAESQPEQEAPAEETIVEKYAKACERDKKITCFTKQLVELSNDKDAEEKDVLQFFRSYLARDLRERLTTPTVQMIPDGMGWFFYENNQELVENASSMVVDLIEKLEINRGKSTRSALFKLHASYFSEQARYGQSLIQQSSMATTLDMFNALSYQGHGILNALQGERRLITSKMREAIDGIPGGDENLSMLAAYGTALDAQFDSPVKQMFNTLNLNRQNAVIPALGGNGTEITLPGGMMAGNRYLLRTAPRAAGDFGSPLVDASVTPLYNGSLTVVPNSGASAGGIIAPGYTPSGQMAPQTPLTTWPPQQQVYPQQQGFHGQNQSGGNFNPNIYNGSGSQFGPATVNSRYR